MKFIFGMQVHLSQIRTWRSSGQGQSNRSTSAGLSMFIVRGWSAFDRKAIFFLLLLLFKSCYTPQL